MKTAKSLARMTALALAGVMAVGTVAQAEPHRDHREREWRHERAERHAERRDWERRVERERRHERREWERERREDRREWERRQRWANQHRHYAPPVVRYAPPPVVHYSPPPRVIHHGPRWARGQYLPHAYRAPQYVVHDWQYRRLSAPPRGYQWMNTGAEYLLVGVATGLILQAVLSN